MHVLSWAPWLTNEMHSNAALAIVGIVRERVSGYPSLWRLVGQTAILAMLADDTLSFCLLGLLLFCRLHSNHKQTITAAYLFVMVTPMWKPDENPTHAAMTQSPLHYGQQFSVKGIFVWRACFPSYVRHVLSCLRWPSSNLRDFHLM